MDQLTNDIENPSFDRGLSTAERLHDLLNGGQQNVQRVDTLFGHLIRLYLHCCDNDSHPWLPGNPRGSAFSATGSGKKKVTFQPVCDNCEKPLGEGDGKCPGPRNCLTDKDPARMKKNREARQERMKKADGDRRPAQTGTTKWKPAVNGTTPGFNPKTSSPPAPESTDRVFLFERGLHVHCNRGCGWNKTHHSRQHAAFLEFGDSFDIARAAPNCPLARALSVTREVVEPETPAEPTNARQVQQPQQEQQIQQVQQSTPSLDAAGLNAVFSMFEHNTTSDTNAALLGTLKDSLISSLK